MPKFSQNTLPCSRVVRIVVSARDDVPPFTSSQILYPRDGSVVNEDDIDMTLWVLLARNLTLGCRKFKWKATFSDDDLEWQHDVLRVKEIRNALFHKKSPELTEDDFREMWYTLSKALKRLGASEAQLETRLSQDLDPQRIELHKLKMREQCLQETNHMLMCSIKSKKHNRFTFCILAAIMIGVIVAIAVPLVVFKKVQPCSSNAHWETTGIPNCV